MLTSFSLASESSLHCIPDLVHEYCSFSSSSMRAKFFFRLHTPESVTCVGCRSKGQRMAVSCSGSRVRHWWHTVCPQCRRRGTRSPCRLNTSSHTRHSTWSKQNHILKKNKKRAESVLCHISGVCGTKKEKKKIVVIFQCI